MRLLGKFGQTVTLATDASFGRHYGEDGDEWAVPAGMDIVLLDSHKERGGALIVNGETEPDPGRHHGREIYGIVRYSDLERYSDDPARPDPRRALWSRP